MANQTELLNVSDEMKLDDVRQDLCELECGEELCSSSLDTTEELYSSSVPDTCGDCVSAGTKRAVNQGISASEGRNGCVFLRVLRQCAGIDLPRGIGV